MDLLVLPSGPPNLQGPYLKHLVGDLVEFYGVRLAGETDWLSARWLLDNRRRPPILHFHWTHYHYTYENWVRSTTMFLSFAVRLLLAKGLGYSIVWTMHNFLPHEQPYPILHKLERRLMAFIADAVIVHCERGRQLLERYWHRRSNVYVIQHGDFASRMPRVPQAEARKCLDLAPDRLIFVYFGGIRPYKGIDQLIRVFRELHAGDATLLVIGKPGSPGAAKSLMGSIEDNLRIVPIFRHVGDDELAMYLCAADVAVLPFRNVLTSGSVITALSFGLPVIAPAVGCLPEVVTSGTGILYDGSDSGLAECLRSCTQIDLETMKQSASRRAEELGWSDMVRETYEVYRRLSP